MLEIVCLGAMKYRPEACSTKRFPFMVCEAEMLLRGCLKRIGSHNSFIPSQSFVKFRLILKPDKKLEKLFIAQGASGFYETA